MKNPSKNPIIFLPGLMGSIGGEMIPGFSSWSFGVAKWIYDPLIEGLEEIGYRKDQNLYICYYDWRKNTEEVVENYLIPTIEKIKKKYPNQPIDLVCHSMGGIVARQYIQGNNYRWDIEKLILMGTPNKGSLDAYYLWSTGQLVPNKKKSFLKILYRGYIWMLTKILYIPVGVEDIEKLHEGFQGLSNLLPAYDYGDFLWVEEDSNQWVRIPRHYVKYKNTRLDKLNMEIRLLKNRVKEIQCFVGTGYETNEDLILDREALLIYQEEAIKDIKTTLEGDNTVTLKSASIEGVENIIVPTTHRGIVKECIGAIAKIYGVELGVNRTATEDVQEEVVEETLHILLKGDVDLSLDLENQTIMSYQNKSVITSLDYHREEFVEGYVWVVLNKIPNGDYSLKLNKGTKQGVKILVMSTAVEKEYSSEVASVRTQEVLNFKIEE